MLTRCSTVATWAGLVVVATVVALAGCDGDDAHSGVQCPGPVADRDPVIDHDLWELASSAEDPFVEHRPDDIQCDADARKAEDFAGTYAYGVDTKSCPYTTVVQPLLKDFCAGDQLYVWLWHFELNAPDGGTAELAVQIGDEIVWAQSLAIPGPSGLVSEPAPVTRSWPAGTPVYFHVRNHGANSYNLLELSRVAE